MYTYGVYKPFHSHFSFPVIAVVLAFLPMRFMLNGRRRVGADLTTKALVGGRVRVELYRCNENISYC